MDADLTIKRCGFAGIGMEQNQHSQVWFSPHGTEWEAETYEEALEMERDSLVEQVEVAREALTYAETLAYEHKPEWVAMFQEAQASNPARSLNDLTHDRQEPPCRDCAPASVPDAGIVNRQDGCGPEGASGDARVSDPSGSPSPASEPCDYCGGRGKVGIEGHNYPPLTERLCPKCRAL